MIGPTGRRPRISNMRSTWPGRRVSLNRKLKNCASADVAEKANSPPAARSVAKAGLRRLPAKNLRIGASLRSTDRRVFILREELRQADGALLPQIGWIG